MVKIQLAGDIHQVQFIIGQRDGSHVYAVNAGPRNMAMTTAFFLMKHDLVIHERSHGRFRLLKGASQAFLMLLNVFRGFQHAHIGVFR